ncbi:unnamed protein product [Pelagomonas calceolata]|uniref:Tudor domain-containing protein n=1 Tax=Pelagomonas calceolata TaxID=35677 RepID=A0A8J2SGI4_9STRA|nr:unnamed protein product [Pelagomonas calceolata]|mmetsp:Transcript_2765/g.8071  ORF Transcript_2765/g.8071 Transcript_2765/m.8071 type:complete len:415 (+) Transcript_2765:106-1350(+)
MRRPLLLLACALAAGANEAPAAPPENLAQFVREALENAYTTRDYKRAVRLLQDGHADQILEVAWDDNHEEVARSFAAKRGLTGADAHAVRELAREMKLDAANRRDLRLWSICVDDVVTSSFELIVAQNYAPVPIRKGETAREVAKEWCRKRDIPEPECDMISATICREAVARGFASSTPAKPTGIQVTEGSRVMARRDGTFQRGVARSVSGKFVDVLFDDGQHQNTSVFDVRALPSPKEPPSSHPSYVWAAVAALQALVLGLVVLRDHRRLRVEPPARPREVSPTPIVPKARDWGARRRRRSATETPSPAVRRSLSTAPTDTVASDRLGLLSATPGSKAHEKAWRKMWATSHVSGDDGAFQEWYSSTFPTSPRSPTLEEEDDDGAAAALEAAEGELRRASQALGAGNPEVAGGD